MCKLLTSSWIWRIPLAILVGCIAACFLAEFVNRHILVSAVGGELNAPGSTTGCTRCGIVADNLGDPNTSHAFRCRQCGHVFTFYPEPFVETPDGPRGGFVTKPNMTPRAINVGREWLFAKRSASVE